MALSVNKTHLILKILNHLNKLAEYYENIASLSLDKGWFTFYLTVKLESKNNYKIKYGLFKSAEQTKITSNPYEQEALTGLYI